MKGTPPIALSNHKNTPTKSRLEDILVDTCTVLFKAAKVMKDKGCGLHPTIGDWGDRTTGAR